jgi:hypothetical protein
MELKNRFFGPTLLLAALALGFLLAAPAVAAVVYVEGSIAPGPSPDCVLVRDQEGHTYALEGTGWRGIVDTDRVRLEGSIVPENRCGVTSAFRVADVDTIWTDDAHRVVYYERTKDGRFASWVRRHREKEWREWENRHNIPPPPPPQ